MNRRQFIGSAAAVSLTAAASFARAHDHAGHTHHAGHGEHAHSAPRAYEAARKAAAHCVEAGQICLAHLWQKYASKPANNVPPPAKNTPATTLNAKPATNLAWLALKNAKKLPLKHY